MALFFKIMRQLIDCYDFKSMSTHLGLFYAQRFGNCIHSTFTFFCFLRAFCTQLYIWGAYDKFPDFFRMGIDNCRRFLKIHHVIAIHLMRWLTNFYDFSFKWTATAAIGIHPTDCHSWGISKMQSGREDTLEERYAIKCCFKLGKKRHRNIWNASDCFLTILHESSISFWVT